jgi:hypothetical protein
VDDQRGRRQDAEAWGVYVARVLAFLTFVPAVDAEQLVGLLAECFGHQVEADDAEHEPCREPEDEVLVVAEPQGREATDQCGDECSKRHKNGDHVTSFRGNCGAGG